MNSYEFSSCYLLLVHFQHFAYVGFSHVTHLPVLLRLVLGVTVSLDGHNSIDYYQDSVTLDVSTRRPSHVP